MRSQADLHLESYHLQCVLPEKTRYCRNATNQSTVPTGTRVKSNFLPFEQINRTDLAFLSHLREGQGIELILDAMPEVGEESSYL